MGEEGKNIFDIEYPDWAAVNADGIWCGFCGELLIASWHVDEDTECPECCPACGGPDDVEAMAEYFA